MVKLRIPKASRFVSSSSSSSSSSSGGSTRHVTAAPPSPPLLYSSRSEGHNLAQDDQHSASARRFSSSTNAIIKKKKAVASILDSPRRMIFKHRHSSRSSNSNEASLRALQYQQNTRREHRDEITTPLTSATTSLQTSPNNTPARENAPQDDNHNARLVSDSSLELTLPCLDHSSVEYIHLQPRIPNSSKCILPKEENVLNWMECEAPTDILPKILSFAGARKMRALAQLNKSWRKMVLDEAVWRTACEDTRKWKEGDEFPSSWLQLYKDTPIVPTDFSKIETAFDSICQGSCILDTNVVDSPGASPRRYREQRRNVKILLKPGKYVLREALTVHAMSGAEVTIESMEEPWSAQQMKVWEEMGEVMVGGENETSRSKKSLRDLLSCCSASATSGGQDEMVTMLPPAPGSGTPNAVTNATTSGITPRFPTHCPPRRATITLKTRNHNEPILRVRSGKLNLNKVKLVHSCSGTDIWNGNSAVQVQPAFDADDRPIRAVPPSIPPTAIVTECDIMSFSGRGIVNIDGGKSSVTDCYIHNCAATGVYVGGPGSVATIERTDVLENGNGNQRSRRGIARGHSGIYLEQGVAHIRDCNISNNSLTGISAISHDNATLEVEESDLVANGSIQLEMPPNGSISRQRSVSRNNRMTRQGQGRSRSRLVSESEMDLVASIGQLRRFAAEQQQLQQQQQRNDAVLQRFMRTNNAVMPPAAGVGMGGGGTMNQNMITMNHD